MTKHSLIAVCLPIHGYELHQVSMIDLLQEEHSAQDPFLLAERMSCPYSQHNPKLCFRLQCFGLFLFLCFNGQCKYRHSLNFSTLRSYGDLKCSSWREVRGSFQQPQHTAEWDKSLCGRLHAPGHIQHSDNQPKSFLWCPGPHSIVLLRQITLLARTSACSFTSHLGRNTSSLPQCLPLLPSQHLQLHQFQRKSLHLPLVNRLMFFFSLLPFTNLSHAAHINSHVLQFKTSRLTMALPQNSAKPGSPQGRGVPDHPGGDSRLKPCCADRWPTVVLLLKTLGILWNLLVLLEE